MRHRILIVDDEPGLRRAVERVLRKHHELALAAGPEEALELCPEFRPDLAILDVQMPGMDGYELMGRLKEMSPDLDVILMTGSLDDADRKLARAIREKAFYFILKPFDREVLLTLVERCLELHRLAADNRAHVARLESELAQARAFQQSLLPAPLLERNGVRFDARYIPCEALGGDFIASGALGDETTTDADLAFLIADVSGHGAAAAMLTGIVKSAFQSLRRQGADPAAVVERIASGLATFDAERFVTIFCGRVLPGSGTLEYVNAGHPPGVLIEPDGSHTRLKRSGPLVTAALEGLTWRKQSIPFAEGARLVLYTDGIVEARTPDDELFGEERFFDEVCAAATGKHARPADALLEAILGSVETFTQGRPNDDDLTLLQVSRPTDKP